MLNDNDQVVTVSDNPAPKQRDATKDESVLKLLRKRLALAIESTTESRTSELDDLRFYAGSPDNQWQWPDDVINSRNAVQGQSVNARPCLTINKLPQHVHQVTNDQRQNRPTIKVIPVSGDASVKMAEIFDGVCRHIEARSDADVAYDTACTNEVIYGEGYVRLETEYCDPFTFDQDIRIRRIRNSFSVYLDPTSQDPSASDINWGIISETMLVDDFETNYPDATPVNTLLSTGTGDEAIAQWITDETVRIAEYFYYETTNKVLNLYPNNTSAIEGSPADKALRKLYQSNPIRTRKTQIRKVKRVKTNGYEILEENDWAGSYIPIIRVVGNEIEVEGRLYYSGLVRNAKDAQRMYNYWNSQEAEMLALAPKAPFIGYAGQFKGFEEQWRTANTNNWPYLEVNASLRDGKGNMVPLPQRAQPPMASSALLQAKAGASEDIKSTTGQYNASLGMTSNERSGKAILARSRESETGTYHYGDNLARMVRNIGRQLIDLIPKIYDTNRIATIIGEDGQTTTVQFDPDQTEAVKEIQDEQGDIINRIYNPSVGKYEVTAVTGPGYATKRQEAQDSMDKLLQTNPELWKVAGDLFIKNMDWPGATEMAKRMQRYIDPKLLDDDNDPKLLAANQQIQAMAQEMEQMHQMLMNVQNSVEAKDMDIKAFKAQVDAYNAETNRIKATLDKWSPEQIQDIVLGTIHAAVQTGDISGNMPSSETLHENTESFPENELQSSQE